MRPYQTWIVVGWFLLTCLPVAAAAAPTFEKDIWSLIKAHCRDCQSEGKN